MQSRKPSNSQVSSRKGASSQVSSQPNPAQQQRIAPPPAKQKDDSLLALIKQFLDKNGYTRTCQTLKTEKPVRKPQSSGYAASKSAHSNSCQEQKTTLQVTAMLFQCFDKGNRDQLFKRTAKMFSPAAIQSCSEQQAHFLRRLEFELNIYFCIYSIHPCTPGPSKKGQQVEKAAAEAFKKYIETKGCQISDQNELLVFFSLPYIPRPQDNPTMARVFTKEWLHKLRQNLQNTVREHINRSSSSAANKENKKSSSGCTLQEIYDQHMMMNESKAKIECDEKSEQVTQMTARNLEEIQELRNHNKDMMGYIDIMQQNLKDLNEATKNNLVESNRKWFQFSKDILQLAKRALRGEKEVGDKLERYQKFFGLNIDELIYSSADISIFEKNSYFTEDVSMTPADIMQRKVSQGQPQRAQEPQQHLSPIDVNKISMLFNRADKKENEQQICLVLKALKDRLYFHKNAVLRREVIVFYQRNDVCSMKPSNYHLQKKLLFEGGEKVREFYLRLMNHISTDNLGNQYLSGSEKLTENLIGIMGTTDENVVYRKHVFGILQRFSYIKQSQLTMISFGIIPMIFKIFRNESDQLQYTSIQYLMGLIMNLAIKKESIVNFEKHKSDIFPILLKFIDVDDNQIKGYVNGTFYVLLQLESIRREALEKYHLKEIIEGLLEKSQEVVEEDEIDEFGNNSNIVIRQYKYILERLNETPGSLDANEDDYEDDDEDYYDEDIEEELDMMSENDESNSSEYIEGEEAATCGEELLMKKYALLGPEAVREEILTRSILDETSRKSHNMTTSINHSKRIDKVFQKNEGQMSVLGGKLDLSLTPAR